LCRRGSGRTRLRGSALRGLGLKRCCLLRDGRRQRRGERGRGGGRGGSRRRLRRARGRLRRRRRYRGRRRDGLSLARRVRDRHGIGHIVDDDRVVHVVVDHVVRRRRHVSGRTHPNGYWPVDRHRQHKNSDGRRWRDEHHKIRRGRP